MGLEGELRLHRSLPLSNGLKFSLELNCPLAIYWLPTFPKPGKRREVRSSFMSLSTQYLGSWVDLSSSTSPYIPHGENSCLVSSSLVGKHKNLTNPGSCLILKLQRAPLFHSLGWISMYLHNCYPTPLRHTSIWENQLAKNNFKHSYSTSCCFRRQEGRRKPGCVMCGISSVAAMTTHLRQGSTDFSFKCGFQNSTPSISLWSKQTNKLKDKVKQAQLK